MFVRFCGVVVRNDGPAPAGGEGAKARVIGPYRFFFYSNEGSEPSHVHVESAEKIAKFWLGSVAVGRARGCTSKELAEIAGLVQEHRDELLEKWHEYFGNR